VADPVFRYLLPHRAPAGKALIYFPYWRFKGMLFTCLPSGIQDRFLDISQQAVDIPLFPPSVGLRSQALKLHFMTPETTGWFIRPTLPFRQVMDSVLARSNLNRPKSILHQAHIGESLSLLYAPFYAENRLIDAVLNQPVSPELETPFDPAGYPGGAAKRHIRFIATLCPNCGWDLAGRRDALVLHCKNCTSMWQAGKKGLTRVNVAHMPASSSATEIIYLPFWRIRAEVSGIPLASYGDMVRAANLPRVVQPAWEDVPAYFWGPAFKVRPRSFLRLTHQMTLSQPGDTLVPDPPGSRMHPVNLPVSESAEALKINLAGFLKPAKAVETLLPRITATARRYLLVYIPFEVRNHDLVQPGYQIAVNRNQLALAGNL
jgi:hypothetical protein